MRVHLTGSRAFGAAVLKAVLDAGHTVTGVTSLPEGRNGRPDRLAAAAHQAALPWSDTIGPDTVRGADVITAAHSHAFVGRRTRAAVAHTIGYHPSLLPLHRGRDAVRWAVRDHDRITGGTVYHLTDHIDAGPVAAQDWCFIRPDDTAETLWRRELAPLGVRLLLSVLTDLDRGLVVCVPQDPALAAWEPAMNPPRLHRPELPELPSAGARWVYSADPLAARPAGPVSLTPNCKNGVG